MWSSMRRPLGVRFVCRQSALWNEALSFGAALLCRMYMPEGRARKAFRMCCAAMACSRAERACAMPASHVRTQSLLRVKHVCNSVQSAPESKTLIAADIPSSFATWGCLRSPVRMRTCVRTTLRRQATYTHAYTTYVGVLCGVLRPLRLQGVPPYLSEPMATDDSSGGVHHRLDAGHTAQKRCVLTPNP